MNIQVDREGAVSGLTLAIDRALTERKVTSLILFSCDANQFEPVDADAILQTISVPVCGGIFPAVLSGMEKMERGTVVIALTGEVTISTLQIRF